MKEFFNNEINPYLLTKTIRFTNVNKSTSEYHSEYLYLGYNIEIKFYFVMAF